MKKLALAGIALAALAAPALANDSTAALSAGGLELVRNDDIAILSEDLHVSAKEITVTYHFRNTTNHPVTYYVAFPLPSVDASTPEEANFVLPDPASDNFVDFEVSVDGQKVAPQVYQAAIALGVDRSDVLRKYGLPLNPASEALYDDKLKNLPEEERDELNRMGLVIVDEYNVQAAWKLDTTFYWQQTFEPGREIVVKHRYKPVVGFGFFGTSSLDIPEYKEKYCFDDSFAKAARTRLKAIENAPNPYYDEQRISYILMTANNWATSIGKFHLVVDKGEADALVSFCGEGVRKISPTSFEVTAANYAPEKDLEILIAKPRKDDGGQ
ncbi:MAG: DUF4424 domain-containing protein [Rhizobiales bacterium]|nr:DUF4424 domain-containing protein [Hyphomicrobiales bacterium]